MPNRHIDTIRNTATSYCMQRVTALWHLHVKTPKPPAPPAEDEAEDNDEEDDDSVQ